MKVKALIVTAVLALLLLLPIDVQAEERDVSMDGVSVILYNAMNGMPTEQVTSVVQTNDGFIWIGTKAGLVRYDGQQFYLYPASSGITSVETLYADEKNGILVGMNNDGLALITYDEGITIWNQYNGRRIGDVHAIIRDSSGNVFFGGEEGLFFLDQQHLIHEVEASALSSRSILGLTRDEDTIYGINDSSEIFTIKSQRIVTTHNLYGYDFCSIYADAGQIFCGSEGEGIYSVTFPNQNASLTLIRTNKLAGIRKMLRFKDVLMLCADNGIGYLDEDNREVVLSGFPTQPENITDIYPDNQDNLWVTSDRLGLFELTPNFFQDVGANMGLNQRVLCACKHQNIMYVGTEHALFALDNNNMRISTRLARTINQTKVFDIQKDRDGNLYVGTERGLYWMDRSGNIQLLNTKDGLPQSEVRVILPLSTGLVAVGGDKGIAMINRGVVRTVYGSTEGMNCEGITTMCETPEGALYIGTSSHGIYILQDKSVRHFNHENGLTTDDIVRIRRDGKSDGYWILTGNSIQLVDKGVALTVESFPQSSCYDLRFNDSGDAWIMAADGIYVVRRDDLMKDKVDSYRFFNVQIGLPCLPTPGAATYMGNDGILYVCGTDTIYSVDSNANLASHSNALLSVPYVQANGVDIPVVEGKVTVPSYADTVTITPYVLSYNLSNPYVSYYLVGFSDEQTVLRQSEVMPIVYTNLPGGDYRFYLSVIDEASGKILNESETLVTKERKITETAWFVMAMVGAGILVLVGLFFLFYRLFSSRIRYENDDLKELNEELLSAFGKAIDSKERFAAGHSTRVSRCAYQIAKGLGLKEEECEEIRRAGLVHDAGKIPTPSGILEKPGRLNEEEVIIVKKHALDGYGILQEITAMPELAIGAGFHHERVDGTGYPYGIAGDNIPKSARIIGLADAYDAMNSIQPYRAKMKKEEILAELRRESGKQFDALAAEVLIRLIENDEID